MSECSYLAAQRRKNEEIREILAISMGSFPIQLILPRSLADVPALGLVLAVFDRRAVG